MGLTGARLTALALALLLALGAAVAAGLALGSAGFDLELIAALRAPRVAAAVGVGALLALAGLAMQVLLRNPLADPYVLGTSGGASVGGLLALMAGASLWLGAGLGALAAGGLLLALTRGALQSLSAGDAWVLASALPWSVHVLLIGQVANRLQSAYLLACGQFVVCAVISGALGLATEPISAEGLRIDNAGDKDYQLARTYPMVGRSAQLGLRWRLPG